MPCRAFFPTHLDPPGQGTAGGSHHALQLAWSLQQEIHTQLEHKQGPFCCRNYHPKVSLQKMLGWASPQTAWKAGPPSQGSVPGTNPNAHPGSSYPLSTHWVQDDEGGQHPRRDLTTITGHLEEILPRTEVLGSCNLSTFPVSIHCPCVPGLYEIGKLPFAILVKIPSEMLRVLC